MSNYKSTWKRKLFDPTSTEPFKFSRSKIDLFANCPRCFYLDLRCGVGRPSMPAFTLNNAVDHLMKKEFDIHRSAGTVHPLLVHYGIKAIPYVHPELENWRQNFIGIQHLYEPENFLIFGAVDDIWINEDKELVVVDYKATSKDDEIRQLDDTKWHNQYRRQIEIYQWLLRQNGFKVSNTGYFVYVNGKKDKKAFDGKLEFATSLIPYKGDDSWIPKILKDIKKCLLSDFIPQADPECEYCQYVQNIENSYEKYSSLKIPVAKKRLASAHKSETEDPSNSSKPTLF